MYGGLCYAYGENENCIDSDLRKLVLAYIILVSIGLGFLGLICCCSLCGMVALGAGALAMKAEEASASNPGINANLAPSQPQNQHSDNAEIKTEEVAPEVKHD